MKHRDEQVGTGEENAELPAYCSNLACVPITKVDFSATAKKRCIDEAEPSNLQALRYPKPAPTRPSDLQWAQVLADVDAADTKPAFLSLLDNYAESYKPTASKHKSTLLCNIYKNGLLPSLADILKECENVASGISIEPEVCL